MLQHYKNETKALFLAHGYVGEILGKTINGVLMHSELFNVVALIDRNKVGISTRRNLPGVDKEVPVYASLSDALPLKPSVLILMENSVNTSFDEIKLAIRLGMDIINPAFNLLNNNAELVALAIEHHVKLIDLRGTKGLGRNPDGRILNIKAKVVFVAGTDCGLGKRTAAYEMVLEAKRRGIKAAFAATGQTGIMLGCDGGLVYDSITAQFAAGAVEELLYEIDKKGFDLIFLEGQGALMHYGTSCVLGLLHAGNPHAIVMVHDQKRKQHVEYGSSPIFNMGTLKNEIDITEKLALPGGNKFKVVAIATIGSENMHTLEQMRSAGEIQNLPIADARVTGGSAILLDAVLDHLKQEYNFYVSDIELVSI